MSKPEEECNLSKAICNITIDLVQALALERDFLKDHIKQLDRDIATLRGQGEDTLQSHGRPTAIRRPDSAVGERSETTYLHIIGGLLMLLLGRNPSGQSYSSFTTQESVVSALVEHYGKRSGMSERTLLAKFAAAKRALARE